MILAFSELIKTGFIVQCNYEMSSKIKLVQSWLWSTIESYMFRGWSVAIVRLLDLQLPVQSVPITTKVVSSNHAHATLCEKVCQWLATGRWFSVGTLVSSTDKTDHPDITETLLKVVLNTMAKP